MSLLKNRKQLLFSLIILVSSAKEFIILFFLIFSFNIFANHADSTTSIRLAVVGDLMCHSPQFEAARVNSDSFNFSFSFKKIKKYISSADFAFGNLETVIAGSKIPLSGYPRFNTPVQYLSALRNAGFDLLITANNHALDQGEYGVRQTIKNIKKNNLSYVGTFSSQKDRDSIRIYNIKGIKVSILAYSYGTNGNLIPKDKSYLINLINFNLIKKDIKKAREKKADVVIVYLHFGKQYSRLPIKSQETTVDSIISFGADIILGDHPHVLEPAYFYKTKNAKLDTGFVIYSLGNFISNQRWRYSNSGAILYLNISKNNSDNSIKIDGIEYTPTWVFNGRINNKDKYIILNSSNFIADTSLNFLSYSDIQEMVQAFQDTRETLRKYTSQIYLFKENQGFNFEGFDFPKDKIKHEKLKYITLFEHK
jgi:poly-gamma-glutamate capsule biosynthesis protein CapA/YwtB (metallophosphatase superfamily)